MAGGVVKLPRLYRGAPYHTGDCDEWTSEYTLEDWNASMDYTVSSAEIPLSLALRVYLAANYLDNPGPLMMHPFYASMRMNADEIRQMLRNFLERIPDCVRVEALNMWKNNITRYNRESEKG